MSVDGDHPTPQSELQALFSNIQPHRASPLPTSSPLSPVAQSTNSTHGPPDRSSIPSTVPANTLPAHSSFPARTSSSSRMNMAPPTHEASTAPSNQSQSLLSLLRFGPAGGKGDHLAAQLQRSTSEDISSHQRAQGKALPSSDLSRAFTTSPAPPAPFRDENDAEMARPSADDSAPPNASQVVQDSPQNALLKLLNRSQFQMARENVGPAARPFDRSPAVGSQPSLISTSVEGKPSEPVGSSREDSPFRVFGGKESRDNTPFEPPQIEPIPTKKENKPLFTYTNPFEALNASRIRSTTPQVQPSSDASPLIETQIREPSRAPSDGERDKSDEALEPQSMRRILTPRVPIRLASASQREASFGNMSEQAEEPDQTVYESFTASALGGGKQTEPSIFAQRTDSVKGVPNDIVQSIETSQDLLAAQEVKAKGGDSDVHRYTGNEANHDTGDAWESANDSVAKAETHRIVQVYNFPIKPFVSITLNDSRPSEVCLRDDGVMEISRLKRDFDQLDRSLAAATNKYITYALVKHGGMRIIRQDDGLDRPVFKSSQDRIFSVAISTTATNSTPSDDQAVIGVGVSGSVYYATISKEGNDLFQENLLETESLVFPPHPMVDEHTSGGALKTRAKRSSRHPEFFAVGRGKAIHIIWPATAMSSKYGVTNDVRKVDVEKFYKDRSLRISTGKAGKDFAFSEDDTLIVSLDKTGRLRFWDIRSLVDESNATATKVAPIDVQTPLLVLATSSPAEKSWPTSVLFVDKLRPYTKAAALRYVLVGLKQNHTLQLWDIGLGKAVQEINFPHETETDGICSVCYHPSSGIIVVGHPTRNSIYFVHLSAPRYTLMPMSQATYLERLAMKDEDLPKPDSTACMSGIREVSFAPKGHLRSIELLPVQKSSDAKHESDDLPLFELYVVHSKGVTCLNIRKDDLGWSSDGKVLKPVDAAQAGLISMKELRLGSVIDETAETNGQAEPDHPLPKVLKKKASKKNVESHEALLSGVDTPEPTAGAGEFSQPGLANGQKLAEMEKPETPVEKESKKSRKRAVAAAAAAGAIVTGRDAAKAHPSSTDVAPPPAISAEVGLPADEASTLPLTTLATTRAVAASTAPPPASMASGDQERVTVGISGDWLDREMKKLEHGVSAEFKKELKTLYQHIQNDRNVQDSAAVARQEAVLRLISTTLSSNVEASLSHIIAAQIQQVVVPAVTSVTVQAVQAQVGEAIARSLRTVIPHEVATQLPGSINTAMQNPQMTRMISETVSQKVTSQVQAHVADLLRTTLTPTLTSLTTTVAAKAAEEVESRLGRQLHQVQVDRENDTSKLNELHDAVIRIGEALSTMQAAQLDFQEKIMNDRHQLVEAAGFRSATPSRPVSAAPRALPGPIAPPTPVKGTGPADMELDEISQLMNDGHYEQGSIAWLQSSQPVDLFDKLFVRYTPDYLNTEVSPLVAFTVGITVGSALQTNTPRRLEWIDAAFGAVNLHDKEMGDLSEYAPGLLHTLIERLGSLYNQTSERNPNDPLLRVVAHITRKARDMRAFLTNLHQHRQTASVGRYSGYE